MKATIASHICNFKYFNSYSKKSETSKINFSNIFLTQYNQYAIIKFVITIKILMRYLHFFILSLKFRVHFTYRTFHFRLARFQVPKSPPVASLLDSMDTDTKYLIMNFFSLFVLDFQEYLVKYTSSF